MAIDLPRPLPNCYWVEPGRLLAGEYPGDLDERVARHKLRALLEAGLTYFLDLTAPYEPGYMAPLQPYAPWLRDEAAARGLTVTHTRHPIPDYGVPDSRAAMATILNQMDTALQAGERVYLHCWGGVGRTGTVVGCYLVRRGRTGAQALDELSRVWRSVPKSAWYPRSPQTEEQVEFVRRWQGDW